MARGILPHAGLDGRCHERSGSSNLVERRGREEIGMENNVYKFIELVGTSTESWEKAAAVAVETAAKTLRDLRIAEVVELDMQIDGGKVVAYRTKVKLSFKIDN